ncbi:MAG: HEAT repeat domain-containing protein [Deltaproteobacteria bacterium]|nr:HEAT repeat domain-containing protein [Deltaproteobacteria bacterium]
MKRLQTGADSMDGQGKGQKKQDAKSAEQLVYALNFIKMQAGMYPEGHSMISQGIVSVLDVLKDIFIFKPQIVIRVEDDVLYVGDEILDDKNRNNKQFAKWLNDLYITSITLSRGLTKDELLILQKILVMRTSDILVLGDIEKFFADSRMPHIKVKGIDLDHLGSMREPIMDRGSLKERKPTMQGPDAGYSGSAGGKVVARESPGEKRPQTRGPDSGFSGSPAATIANRESVGEKGPRTRGGDAGGFRAMEGESAAGGTSREEKRSDDALWRKFTSALITQSQDEGAQISRSAEYSHVDSQDLVKHLNEETINWDVFLKDYRSLIIKYLRSENEEDKPTLENIILKIDSLVKDFHPELQQQMLKVTEDELCTLPTSAVKDNKINCFNYETIAGILRSASDEKRGISPSLSLLFQRMSVTHNRSDGPESALANSSSSGRDTPTSASDIEKLLEREQYENYVPADYEEILKRKSKGVEVDRRTKGQLIAGDYIHTLEDTALNLQISKLFLALMDENVDEGEYGEISVYVTGSIPELILTGNFPFLIDIIETYKRHGREKPSEKIRALAESGAAAFQDTKLLSRCLRDLFLHGISINSLIGFVEACGPGHVPWLLDLYLEAWSPKGQAMIVEVLRHFREEATSRVYEKLSDPAVQAAGKLLILLQLIGDADAIPHVRPFADHPDVAIRVEAIRTLLRFNDNDAPALLRRAISSRDRSESTQGMALACEYKIGDICERLISRIRTGLIFKKDLVFNEFIIPEVIKTRDPKIIQNLEKMAGAKWSLSPGRLSRTKMALLDAIELYASPGAVQLLRRSFRSGNQEMQTLCGELMKRESE